MYWIRITLILLVCCTPRGEMAGAQQTKTNNPKVIPFKIHVTDDVLQDLQLRLARSRLPDQIDDAGWQYGTDLAYLKELTKYWRTQYDWRVHEATLNRFAQFKTNLDGYDLHFVHQRSKHPHARPLVLLHGWPGSFFEFYKIVDALTDPESHGGQARDAFHVIIPSLPGFGFSEKPRDKGWNNGRIAQTIAKLMARLGYDRYSAQGGDWGATIATWLGRNDADHCTAIHINFVIASSNTPGSKAFDGLTEAEINRVQERQQFMAEERGYSQIQGTNPQTLGYGLNDSPTGLAAWIVEKFRSWSDCQGDLEQVFTKDELLTNIMIYWTTETITSSTRIYYETRHSRSPGTQGRVQIPVGCALFPKELVYAPRKWAENRFHVTHWTEMPRGGHFAALEQLLLTDIRKFFRTQASTN